MSESCVWCIKGVCVFKDIRLCIERLHIGDGGGGGGENRECNNQIVIFLSSFLLLALVYIFVLVLVA